MFKDLVLFVLHDLPVGGLFGQHLSSSTLQDGFHRTETRADPRCKVEVLPLHHMKQIESKDKKTTKRGKTGSQKEQRHRIPPSKLIEGHHKC